MDTQNQYKRLSPKLISAVLAVMEANRGTVPKTEREKKLAQLAPPDDTITQADVVVGRTKNFQPKQKMTPKMESRVPGVAAGSLPNDGHLCASKIMHEEWGEGTPIYSQHAEPDEAGNIEWYDIMFEHGIERAVSTDSIEILQTESHMNHKPKKRGMKEEVMSTKSKRIFKEAIVDLNSPSEDDKPDPMDFPSVRMAHHVVHYIAPDGTRTTVGKLEVLHRTHEYGVYEPNARVEYLPNKEAKKISGSKHIASRNTLYLDNASLPMTADHEVAKQATAHLNSGAHSLPQHVKAMLKAGGKFKVHPVQSDLIPDLPHFDPENLRNRGMKEEVEQVDEIFGLSKKEKYAKKRKELAQKIVAGNPEARARRMEAMKINKTGEKAVAPELQNKYDQEDADESPKIALTAQMRHAFDKNKRSQKGYTVTFENGDKVAVPSAQAHMFLTMIAKMGRNADMRDRFQKMAAKSYKEFVKAIEQ